MPLAADAAPAEDAPPAVSRAGFAMAWGVFWLLMITVAVQQQWREGRPLWEPVLWEGSSCLAATVVVWALWRRVDTRDALLVRPWRWFAAALVWLPLVAPLFVAAIYGIRHGVYALLGLSYRHDAWGPLLVNETLRFSIFYLLFVAVLFGMRSYQMLAHTRLRLERQRALAQHAQLLQLAQQIQPHFLFNALNTVASTIHDNPDLAETLLLRLAALLRAATDLAREPETTLAEELGLLEAYGAIMGQRFADRVGLRFEVDPALRGCRVPTLLLQPLLENAFRHAVEPRRGPTTIVVRAAAAGPDRLRLEVQDDGDGVPADGPAPPDGTGLGNLRQRLRARHGDAAVLTLMPRAGGGTVARIELPCVS